MGCITSGLNSKPGVRFSDIKHQVKPLDLIAFRGNDFVSDTISLVQKIKLGSGDWTHVGIVISPDLIPIPNARPGRVYVWESTMSGPLGGGATSIESGRAQLGVQIRDLANVIDRYDDSPKSKIGWCKLVNNPLDRQPEDTDQSWQDRTTRIKNALTEFHTSHGSLFYDYEIASLLGSVSDTCACLNRCRTSCFGKNNKLFCSELVVSVLQIVDLVNKNISPDSIAPMELLGHTNNPENLRITGLFAEPIVITRDWPGEYIIDAVSNAVAEAKDEIMVTAKAEVKQEVREEVKAEVKVEVREEAKAEIKDEIHEETKAEVKAEAREEIKAEVREEIKAKLFEEI